MASVGRPDRWFCSSAAQPAPGLLAQPRFLGARVARRSSSLLPRIIFGSAYADMRLMPYTDCAVALLAIRFRADTHRRTARGAGGPRPRPSSWCGSRATTTSYGDGGRVIRTPKLEALNHIPMGARVVTLVGQGCRDWWAMPRNSHLRRNGHRPARRASPTINGRSKAATSSSVDLPEAGRISRPTRRRSSVRQLPDPQRRGSNAAARTQSMRRFGGSARRVRLCLADRCPAHRSRNLTQGMKPVWQGPGSCSIVCDK